MIVTARLKLLCTKSMPEIKNIQIDYALKKEKERKRKHLYNLKRNKFKRR